MDRRKFIKTCLAGSVGASLAPSYALAGTSLDGEDYVKDYLSKIKNFNQHFSDDIVLRGSDYRLLKSVTSRIKRLQSYVGYANFSLLSFDRALYYAKNYSRIGSFTKAEINFLESIFYTNAKDYGFFGEKVLLHITDHVKNRDIIKIPRTGHYVFRGESLRFYHRIRREVGRSVTLTSGVRGVMKQMYLFLAKSVESKGNLSMASRSLAPPGHSYHGVGDFDVGKVGYGYKNFTEDFAKTDEFKRLKDLGFVRIRYHEKNPFGVRYEPWHIKVIG